MIYLTEEHVEDAFAAYLSRLLPSVLHISAAYAVDALTFPRVIVGVKQSDNSSEAEVWSDERIMDMDVQLLVEAPATKKERWGSPSARATNAGYRTQLLAALAASDVREEVSSFGGLSVRNVVVGPIVRSVVGRIFETTIGLAVLVSPDVDDMEPEAPAE